MLTARSALKRSYERGTSLTRQENSCRAKAVVTPGQHGHQSRKNTQRRMDGWMEGWTDGEKDE